jgi:hypothetical protein
MNTIILKKTHRAQYVILVQAILATVGSLYYQYYGDPVTNILAGDLFASSA